jgi:hypothetical protein
MFDESLNKNFLNKIKYNVFLDFLKSPKNDLGKKISNITICKNSTFPSSMHHHVATHEPALDNIRICKLEMQGGMLNKVAN